ncbi:MAG: DNA methyltransferase [Cyanobacteria bacterium P01_H01_bin.26]
MIKTVSRYDLETDLNAAYSFHRYANFFPMMQKDEFVSLITNIAKYGLREKIWLYEGQILDGRNRYLACQEADVMPQFREFRGTPEQALQAVMSWNLERRHLTTSQRAVLALEVMPEFEKLAKERQFSQGDRGCEGGRGRKKTLVANSPQGLETDYAGHNLATQKPDAKPVIRITPDTNDRENVTEKPSAASPKPSASKADTRQKTPAKSREQAAATVGVGQKIVQKVKKVQQEKPELIDAIRNGEITVNKAVKQIKQEQREQDIAAQVSTSKTQPTVECCDAIAWLKQQDSYDLLLTDPPYSTDVEDIAGFAQSWLPLALAKLKSTGRAFVCVGAYPEELQAYLSVELPEQILVWTYRNTLGPTPKGNYKLNWQAILYYKGIDAPPLNCPEMVEQFSVQDIAAPDGRQGDRYHAWQKPLQLGERLVRHATQSGDVVVDPFACTGTFLISAAQLGRVAKGCDISEENLQIAERRGCLV